MVRISLSGAVASLLGKTEHPNYTRVGKVMKAKDLYKMLGLTGSPMLYKYMSDDKVTIDPERAMVFYKRFDMLIDDWLTGEELGNDCKDVEAGRKIAYMPIKEIIDDIVEIDAIEDDTDMRRSLKKLIAKWY